MATSKSVVATIVLVVTVSFASAVLAAPYWNYKRSTAFNTARTQAGALRKHLTAPEPVSPELIRQKTKELARSLDAAQEDLKAMRVTFADQPGIVSAIQRIEDQFQIAWKHHRTTCECLEKPGFEHALGLEESRHLADAVEKAGVEYDKLMKIIPTPVRN